jgi:uncharacterized protein (DUF2345 family)
VNYHQDGEHRARHEHPRDGEHLPAERQERDRGGGEYRGQAAVAQRAVPLLALSDPARRCWSNWE